MKKPANSSVMAALMALFALAAACQAVDYHVASAQDLQNALSLAANNGAPSNNIYITNGYYTGNFNYNCSSASSLTILAEAGVSNTQISIDGAGTGRDMNISCSADASITVQGITFLRNCGNEQIGALRIAGGGGATIYVTGCMFLSPTNSSGMGLEIPSGLNATVTNCMAIGEGNPGNATGISISWVAGSAIVQNCSISTNSGCGLEVSAGVVLISGNIFCGNGLNCDYIFGGSGGALCTGTTVSLNGNTFLGNSGGGASGSGTVAMTLTGNTFFGNSTGGGGGGANCSGGTITLTGNTFTSNSAFAPEYFGGGAYCSGTTVTLSGNIFANNSVFGYPAPAGSGGYGGGAYCIGAVTLSNNTFSGNTAGGGGGDGGGIYCSGSLTMSKNTFTGNSAYLYGGGASSSASPMTAFGNTFQQNNAGAGGGIYASGQMINLLDNLVVQNTSASQSGGLWVDASGTLNMINNTVTGNTTAGSGGGVTYEVTGTVELLNVYNNIIWGNTAGANGADVWLGGTGQQKRFNFNDVDTGGIYGIWDTATNNSDLLPQFFNPIAGDYHTKSTSPCLNAGTTNAPSLPLTDLDGNVRTNSAGMVDMGCYEFTTNVTHPADTNAIFVINPTEFNAYAAAWKSAQTWTNGPNFGPNPISADYLTRAGYLMTNGGAYHNDGSARPVNWKTNSP